MPLPSTPERICLDPAAWPADKIMRIRTPRFPAAAFPVTTYRAAVLSGGLI